MTIPERVEEALAVAQSREHDNCGAECGAGHVEMRDLAEEVLRLRKELSSAMENFTLEMSRKDGRIQELEVIASGRTVSCSNCNSLSGEIDALKEQVRVLKEHIEADHKGWSLTP